METTKTTQSKTTGPVIPQPKTFGPLKNVPHINKEAPVQSLLKLADEFGDIFKFETPAGFNYFLSGHDLVEDACDESRFVKFVGPPLRKLRAFGGDGLFTAETRDPNWKKAHHILMPSFSQRAMQNYHGMMVDIATQLIQKWSRLNSDEEIEVADEMSRLTYDTIGLCGFSYRFNSFYREDMHPFVQSMARALHESMKQLWRFGIQQKVMVRTNHQYQQDIRAMNTMVDQLILDRKKESAGKPQDLLHHMLNGRDPETGETLDDKNIRYQILTFLIAGHETTSGLLSFAIYFLLKNPKVLEKAYDEVDRLLKEPVPTYEEVRSLRYIWMILNESLRLWPTAPSFAVFAKKDTVLAGKYPIKKGTGMSIMIPKLHRDKRVWGENADAFFPERFEDMTKVPYQAFKPFGNGQRACIGQLFALHEAALVLGLILKNFRLEDSNHYQLKIKESLTLKPDNFYIKVRPRQKATLTFASQIKPEVKKSEVLFSQKAHQTPLLVLYGSDLGTAEGIARELADEGTSYGFETQVGALNDFIGKLPKQGALLVVTSSYNGKSPVRAREFVDWLGDTEACDLKGVNYAVFGCGDRNWQTTYQAIPQWIDEQMEKLGAHRFMARGEGDASLDFEAQLISWKTQFWPTLSKAMGIDLPGEGDRPRLKTLRLEMVSEGTSPLADLYKATRAKVIKNIELQDAKSPRSTKHIELALPKEMTYQVGDHLGVIPQNSPEQIDRAIKRFSLSKSTKVILHATGTRAEHFPLEKPVLVSDLLRDTVELQEPATRGMLREMVATTHCPPHKKELESFLNEDHYKGVILEKRVSMLDLLEKYESCEMTFEQFLELLPPLKTRYYSISSDPQCEAGLASLTVAVVEGEAWNGNGTYRGVASNYLESRHEGDDISVFVRHPESGFSLPENSETPIIMIGPGTGLAPFRGFLQARDRLQKEGQRLGMAHLYFGCRNEQDFIYQDELKDYVSKGQVTLHTAFSRVDGKPKTYVQHLLKKNGQEVIDLLDQGGKLYLCGDGKNMALDVEATLQAIYRDVHSVGEAEAAAWFKHLQLEGRYAKDVWVGN